MLPRLYSSRTDLDHVQPLNSTLPYARAGSDGLGLHAARRLLLNGIWLNCQGKLSDACRTTPTTTLPIITKFSCY